MKRSECIPGVWPEISEQDEYERLVRLARRRLVGYEHHAEDVVSRALIKWASIPSHKRSVARIEQVLKTEAYSLLRAEHRARERDTRVASDPSLRSKVATQTQGDVDYRLLRQALAEACRQERVRLSTIDVQVIEMVFAGFNLAEIERSLGVPRHEVRRSRNKWRRLAQLVLSDG